MQFIYRRTSHIRGSAGVTGREANLEEVRKKAQFRLTLSIWIKLGEV